MSKHARKECIRLFLIWVDERLKMPDCIITLSEINGTCPLLILNGIYADGKVRRGL